MRRFIITIITCAIPFTQVMAEQDQFATYYKEWSMIRSKHVKTTYNDEYKNELQICSDKGNYYCTKKLGEQYLYEKEYSDAIKHFTQCSEQSYGSCDYDLGLIYLDGLGVLQNEDKAMFHFRKAANVGVPAAAYNISTIYGHRGASSKNRNTIVDDATYAYAWLKVSMALGIETYNSVEEKDIPIHKLLATHKKFLISQDSLQKADKLANEICSSIEYCKQ